MQVLDNFLRFFGALLAVFWQFLNENLLFIGEEDGTVKLWDKRQSSNMTKVGLKISAKSIYLLTREELLCSLCSEILRYLGKFWDNFFV